MGFGVLLDEKGVTLINNTTGEHIVIGEGKYFAKFKILLMGR